jgi:hypothetical protein
VSAPLTFVRRDGPPPDRPSTVRRVTFDDAFAARVPQRARWVVPLEHVRPGDRQVGTFTAQAQIFGHAPPLALDALARFPDVESVVGAGPVLLRTPLPHVRELITGDTDRETLANLPGLARLAVGLAIDREPLSPDAVAPGLTELVCSRATFGGVEPLGEFAGLRRLAVNAWPEDSVEPLAGLTELRRLQLTAGKGLQHLARLERLEVLELTLESGSLAGFKRFAGWQRLRRLEVSGRALRSLDGIEALAALEALVLRRTAVKDLAPLAGAPALRWVALDERFSAGQVQALRAARPEVEIDWTAPEQEPAPTGTVGPVRYRRLDLGAWAIHQDVTAILDVDDNLAAENRVRGALADDDLDLLARLTLDSDAEALSVHATTASDIRRAAALIAALAA